MTKQFEFAIPLTSEVFASGRKKFVHQGDIIIRGKAYRNRFGETSFDIEEIDANNVPLKTIMELTYIEKIEEITDAHTSSLFEPAEPEYEPENPSSEHQPDGFSMCDIFDIPNLVKDINQTYRRAL